MTRSPVSPARRPQRPQQRRAAATALAALALTTVAGCGTGETDPTEQALQRTLDDLGVESDETLADGHRRTVSR